MRSISLGGGLLSLVFCPMKRNRMLFSIEVVLCGGEAGGLVRRLLVSVKEYLVKSEAVIILEPLSDVGELLYFSLVGKLSIVVIC